MCACHALGHLTDQENHKHIENLKEISFSLCFRQNANSQKLTFVLFSCFEVPIVVNW